MHCWRYPLSVLKPGDTQWCELHSDLWEAIPGHGVYVVELGLGASTYLGLVYDPRYPVVYVGYSFHSPEARFKQHMCDSMLSSSIVRRNGRRLRHDLFDHLPRFRDAGDAKHEEVEHAFRLARLGFHAYFDGNLIRPNSVGPDDETDRFRGSEHVRRAEPWIDQGILSVVACCDQQLEENGELNAEAVEGILRGKRPRHLGPDAVFPAEGQFAYLRDGVLEERVRELVEMGILSDENANGLGVAANFPEVEAGCP